jgi:hypothetical protein
VKVPERYDAGYPGRLDGGSARVSLHRAPTGPREGQGRDALLDRYTGLLQEALDDLAPEERHDVYRMLKLKVNMHPDRMLEVSGFPQSCIACYYDACIGSDQSLVSTCWA